MNQLPNLLIVDDIADNLLLIEIIIRKVEVNLIKALSGTEALEKVKGVELALAIIDVHMPNMNGYELARMLNQERRENKIPIIFHTASNEKHAFEGYDSGAVDYLNKPIPKHVLLSKINVFLDLYNQKRIIVKNAKLLEESAEKLFCINQELKQSEQKYRSYIDNAPDGLFVLDSSGKFLEVNDAICSLTGKTKEELFDMSFQDFLKGDSLNQFVLHFEKMIKTGKAKSDLLFQNLNCTNRWMAVDSVKLEENRYLVFAKDITDRKKTEEDLQNSFVQLQHLAQYSERARENERKAFSRELHDDLGQSLTAVKIDLGFIRQRLSEDELKAKIIKATALLDETIRTVQRLTSQLRPEIIDDLGLEEAIKWYTREFEQRNEISIFLDMDSGLPISPDDSLTLFRIMQESLTNIARHSGANRVDIVLSIVEDNIHFKISDNGKGIPQEAINSRKSFGLIGIKERAVSLAGKCEIYTEVGKGTSIDLRFPLNNKWVYESSSL